MFLEDMKISANVGADDTGMHPLHLTAATHARRWDIMDLLLSFGADIKARDNQGRLPLHTAAMGDRHQAVELLLKKGADPNAYRGDGRSALGLMAWKGTSPGSFELLVRLGDGVVNHVCKDDNATE